MLSRMPSYRFLRASGGVSTDSKLEAHLLQFSPRKRRCFYKKAKDKHNENVFSAQAEVFLSLDEDAFKYSGFLRASGGVSTFYPAQVPAISFSPRKRRCFRLLLCLYMTVVVFSAQAEVFLSIRRVYMKKKCFLRASGGVSYFAKIIIILMRFSPRKRRCFQGIQKIFHRYRVFSAQAEVFPLLC